MPLKLMLVAGARPNFMKIASIAGAIAAHNAARSPAIERILVHTGQHYDAKMSQSFFVDLGIPTPDVDLGVGSGSHAVQTAEVMKRFEPVLLAHAPDAVLVVGDVNSTIACALVAAKAAYPDGRRPKIVHVEAGLRSFDRTMPEEINRLLTDAIADLLFVTEESGVDNLRREGVAPERIHLVGNTMVDTLLAHRERALASPILRTLGLDARGYGVVTLHRPSNVDDGAVFARILAALEAVAARLPLLFPIHPRTRQRLDEFGLAARFRFPVPGTRLDPATSGIHCTEPLGYLDFLCLTANARLVLTDSGGIQEETTVLGVPCVTLRENTERPVTVTEGTNVLAGMRTEDVVRHALAKLDAANRPARPRLWDGQAGERIVAVLARELGLD